MPDNLIANVPSAGVALQDTTFALAGFNAGNTLVIYEIGNPYKSWVPGRPINAITAMEEGKDYMIIPLQNMDQSAVFAPPLPPSGPIEVEPPTFSDEDFDI